MKTSATGVFLILFTLLTSKAYSQQNNCGVNADFELGSTNGWVCRSGGYGTGPCPPTGGTCPSFNFNWTATGAVAGRHTVISTVGFDPNSNNTVPYVPPGGGTFSFKLGNAATGGTGGNPNLAQAEAIRLSYLVTPQNAGFTYRFAAFLQIPGHTDYETLPRFEVEVMDANGTTIPCGLQKVLTFATCAGIGVLKPGANGWNYTDWTTVGLDLTGYIGQVITVEFRTADCFPPGGTTSSTCINGVCTTCINGSCCSPTPCTPPNSGCAYGPGTHSAYAYIDAYCSPLSVQSQKFCPGKTASIQICAPPGYQNYTWPALGQSGQCATVTNPLPGTVYTVNMQSLTGCWTATTVTLLGTDATVRDTSLCVQATGNIPLNVTPTAPGQYTYSWTGPNGFTSTLQNPSVPIPSSTTIYSVTVTDSSGCSVTKPMTINIGTPSPITINGNTSICLGGKTTLTASGANGVSYSWSPVTGLNSPSSAITDASPVQNTTYTVTLTNSAGCTSTKTVDIMVNTISIGVNPPVQICEGKSTTITASGGVSYSWSPTLGLGSPGSSTTTAFPAVTTTYSVTVTDVNGCIGNGTVLVTVNPSPPVTTTSATICYGKSAQIGVVEPGYNYSWSPGTNPQNTQTTTVTPIQSGVYTVTVTDGKGCTNTNTASVTVNPLPIINISPPQAICIGASTTLTASGGSQYLWTGNNLGTPNSSATVVNPPLGINPYRVVVTDQNGCVDSANTQVTVNDLPIVGISPPVAVCIGTPVTLTASGGIQYSWSPNNVNPPNASTTVATPNITTNYTVTVTDINGCVNTGMTTITINQYIPVTVGPNTSFCIGGSTQLTTNAPGGQTYQWIPITGLSDPTIADPIANPTVTTTYTVNVSNSNGCNGSGTVTVTVNPLPIVPMSPNTAICLGSNTQISAGGGIQYLWSPANSLNNPQLSSPTASPTSTTTYSVTVTDANGCKNTGSTTVTVNTITTTISANTSFCAGNSAQLTAGGGAIYSWTPTNGLSNPNNSTTNASPNTTTVYTCYITDINGCKDSKSVTVTVFPPPVAVPGPDKDICEGESTQLTVSGGNAYQWSPGATLNNSTIPNPIARPQSTTTYNVLVSNGPNCPPDTAAITVNVHPIPSVFAGNDTSIMAGSGVQLNPVGTGITYNWSPSTALSCTYCPYPLATPLKTITYYVVTTSDYGCRNSDTITINVDDILTLYVPTGFTPFKYDGKNTMFYAYGVGIYEFEFYIFDRWGAKIFETNDPNVGWDGTYKGRVVQDDVYVWLAKAKSITGLVISRTGPVTVVH